MITFTIEADFKVQRILKKVGNLYNSICFMYYWYSLQDLPGIWFFELRITISQDVWVEVDYLLLLNL